MLDVHAPHETIHSWKSFLRLVIYDAAIAYILSTPLDQLDTPEAEKRNAQISAEEIAAHPAAGFVFGGQ